MNEDASPEVQGAACLALASVWHVYACVWHLKDMRRKMPEGVEVLNAVHRQESWRSGCTLCTNCSAKVRSPSKHGSHRFGSRMLEEKLG